MIPGQSRCRVCGDIADETNSAVCSGCGERFHLNLRNDRPGRDCGQVWLHQEHLYLEFGCFVCLGKAGPAGGPSEPPVGKGH